VGRAIAFGGASVAGNHDSKPARLSLVASGAVAGVAARGIDSASAKHGDVGGPMVLAVRILAQRHVALTVQSVLDVPMHAYNLEQALRRNSRESAKMRASVSVLPSMLRVAWMRPERLQTGKIVMLHNVGRRLDDDADAPLLAPRPRVSTALVVARLARKMLASTRSACRPTRGAGSNARGNS
jgi:hypothetical protein